MKSQKNKRRLNRHLDAWKPVVSKALGIARLYEKRYFRVLMWGKQHGLFEIVGTRETPRIRLAEKPEEPKELPSETPTKQKVVEPSEMMTQAEWDAFVENEKSKMLVHESHLPPWPKEPPAHPPKPIPHPDERKYTYHLACGHRSNALRKRKGKDGQEEIYCHSCKLKTPTDHRWMSLNRGVPMPLKRRRDAENPNGECCDAEGQYIGGLEGDCRYNALKKGTDPCEYHKDRPLWRKT